MPVNMTRFKSPKYSSLDLQRWQRQNH